MGETETCPGCLGVFERTSNEQSPHPYLGACHGCWQMYTEVLAKEFSDPEYFKAHRLTVDAYCAQHIGDQTDRRARQSANLHLIALYLFFEKKCPPKSILHFLRIATAAKHDFPPITQITNPTWLTVLDVIGAQNAAQHTDLINKWGKSVWDNYHEYHDDIISTHDALLDTKQ